MSHFFRLNSIRDRILGGYLFLTFLIVALVIFSAFVINRNRRIASIHSDINELQVHSLNLIKADNDFFNVEIYNQHYLSTRASNVIKKRDSLNSLIKIRIGQIIGKSKNLDYPVADYLVQINALLEEYDHVFRQLENLFFIRGFKDEGIEGSMRSYAHELEQQEGFDKLDLLSMRRAEKDFLIRHDTLYVVMFNRLAAVAREKMSQQRNHETSIKLAAYQDLFIRLSEIQKEIGLSATDGLRGDLGALTEELSRHYFILAHNSTEISSDAQRTAWLFFIAITAAAVVFAIITGYWISKRISEPIARLSSFMEEAIEKRYHIPEFSFNNAAVEINVLTASFSKLMNETTAQMKELKKKSRQLKSRNNELKKLNSELDSFLYSTAHDLRAPLSSLLGVLNLMLRETKQPELVIYIEMMQQAIQRQEAFISQIVEFTKNKRLEIHPEPIDIKNIIEDIFENHRYVESAYKIKHEVIIHSQSQFFSDKNRIKIIFNNLISNAIRYADMTKPNPFVRISIEIDHEFATIQFSDNGIGIESHHLEKIFDMFYRASDDSKGSGLGLFIFSETIQRLNGLMTVTSEINLGTGFFIKLPNLLSGYQIPFNATKAEQRYLAN
ncbi:MAG: HAMP domain-containing sensor histidine kinase [Bacteroidota bacterium]